MYHRQKEEEADIKKSYQTSLRDRTDALIMAAQQQANTRSIEARVYYRRQDPKCRLCKDAAETVQHIVAGCKMKVGTLYTERLTNPSMD